MQHHWTSPYECWDYHTRAARGGKMEESQAVYQNNSDHYRWFGKVRRHGIVEHSDYTGLSGDLKAWYGVTTTGGRGKFSQQLEGGWPPMDSHYFPRNTQGHTCPWGIPAATHCMPKHIGAVYRELSTDKIDLELQTDSKIGNLAVKLAREALFGDRILKCCTPRGWQDIPALSQTE